MQVTVNSSQTKVVKKIIASLKDLIKDQPANLVFNETGMHLTSVDITKVVMIDVNFEKLGFTKYDLSIPQYTIPINFSILGNIFKLIPNDQPINFEFGGGSLIILSGPNSYIVPLERGPGSTPIHNIPVIEYSTKFVFNTAMFQKDMKAIAVGLTARSIIGKRVRITYKGDSVFELSTKGDIYVHTKPKIMESLGSDLRFDGSFGMYYLMCFTKAKLNDFHVMSFSNDKKIPFCFEYQFEHGYVKYYLMQTDD